ncbi:MAG: protein-export chaperone SecB [Bacilli bacterium]|nr:protein-export chaperone SecB [Bacilli bacterium]
MFQFRIENIEALKFQYALNENDVSKIKPQIGVASIITLKGEELVAKLQVKTIEDVKNAFSLDAVVSGTFSLKGYADSKDERDVLKRISIATLYPYLRSYVSAVTSLLSDKKGVTLDIIDVEEIAKNAEFIAEEA